MHLIFFFKSLMAQAKCGPKWTTWLLLEMDHVNFESGIWLQIENGLHGTIWKNLWHVGFVVGTAWKWAIEIETPRSVLIHAASMQDVALARAFPCWERAWHTCRGTLMMARHGSPMRWHTKKGCSAWYLWGALVWSWEESMAAHEGENAKAWSNAFCAVQVEMWSRDLKSMHGLWRTTRGARFFFFGGD